MAIKSAASSSSIYHWSAKRAGGGITIHGVTALGEAVRATNIVEIWPCPGVIAPVTARDKDGNIFRLHAN